MEVNKCAPDRDSAHFEVEQERDGQTQRHPEWNTDDHKNSIANRFPEQRVVREHPAIVREADKARWVQNIVIAEANDDSEENRPAAEQNETDNPRRRAEPAARPSCAEVTAAPASYFLLILTRVLLLDSLLSRMSRSRSMSRRNARPRFPPINPNRSQGN